MSKHWRPSDKQGLLLLRTFQEVERWIIRKLPWLTPALQHLLRGFLVALEDAYIESQVQTTVDQAIEAYKASEEPLTDWKTDVVITEHPSEVPGLPELNLRASWYDRQ